MLNDAEARGEQHVVSWLPCGKMFKVHKHKEFASRVMPLYCRHSKYKSFLRQLSMYKFIRINEGPLRGCYHHPNFERNRLDLIEKINRTDRDGKTSTAATTTDADCTMINNDKEEEQNGREDSSPLSKAKTASKRGVVGKRKTSILPTKTSTKNKKGSGVLMGGDHHNDTCSVGGRDEGSYEEQDNFEWIDFQQAQQQQQQQQQGQPRPNRNASIVGPLMAPEGKPSLLMVSGGPDSSSPLATTPRGRRAEIARSTMTNMHGLFDLGPKTGGAAAARSSSSVSASNRPPTQQHHFSLPPSAGVVAPGSTSTAGYQSGFLSLGNTTPPPADDILEEIIKTFGKKSSP